MTKNVVEFNDKEEVMTKKVVNIDEAVVSNIETKDSKYQALSGILQNLIETHLINSDTSFMESPVILKLQEQITEAKKNWEDAKNDMITKYVDKKIQNKVKNWTLNYATKELTLEF